MDPHFHAIGLEGGFDEEGTFFTIPFSGLQSMVEVYRRGGQAILVTQHVLNEEFAQDLLSWRHSGFSIDNSLRILDDTAQLSLAEEDPLRAVQRTGAVSYNILRVLQAKHPHV